MSSVSLMTAAFRDCRPMSPTPTGGLDAPGARPFCARIEDEQAVTAVERVGRAGHGLDRDRTGVVRDPLRREHLHELKTLVHPQSRAAIVTRAHHRRRTRAVAPEAGE